MIDAIDSPVRADPRAHLIHAAQQCADASAQLLLHHMENSPPVARERFEGELIDRLAEALRTACEVEQDALDDAIAASTRPLLTNQLQLERSDLGQLAAACSNYIGRDA